MGLGIEVSGIFVVSRSKTSWGWGLFDVAYTKLGIAHRDISNTATCSERTGIVSQVDIDRFSKSNFDAIRM